MHRWCYRTAVGTFVATRRGITLRREYAMRNRLDQISKTLNVFVHARPFDCMLHVGSMFANEKHKRRFQLDKLKHIYTYYHYQKLKIIIVIP